MKISSPAFKHGEVVPVRYTCKGQNISPPLSINDVPAPAKSLALIMHDPDAPVGDFVHWTVWGIQPSVKSIEPNLVPAGATQGVTSFGANKYGGPCPPSGTHRYMFELYALDTVLKLPPATTRGELELAMKGHSLEVQALTGTFSAS